MTQKSSLGTKDFRGAPQQAESRRTALKSWAWATGMAIFAAVVYRFCSDPIALECPKPTADMLKEGVIYVCSFGYPKLDVDNLFFGCLYVWTAASLLTTLVGMKWKAAGLVMITIFSLMAADIASEVIAQYLK